MNLPKGWIATTAGNLFKIRNGYAFKSKDFLTEGIHLVKQTNLNGDTVNFDKCNYLPSSYLDEYKRFTLKKDDVLIGMSGSIGKLCIYDKDFLSLQNQRTGKIELIDENNIDWKFIWHYLNTIEKQLKDEAKGVAVANVSASDIEGLPINLPPLNEQKRIAKKLDELLATVESIKTRLDKAPTIIKRFRQSILAAATSGKLTEKWREENKVSDFKDEVLGSLLEHSANGLSKRSGTEGDEIVVLRLADYKNGIRAKGKERTILMTEKEQNKYILDKGDILVVRVNGSKEIAGLFTIYSGENEAYCDHFIRLSLDTNVVLPEYVMYIANEGEGRNYIRHKLVSNAGQNTINQKSLFGLTIPLPSLEEQKEIVSQVESLFSLADTLEEKIEAAKKRVDKLTQSILAKAFKGELIPQDPNDEPAEMLLERIKAEQEKEKPKKTRKKK